MPETCIFCKIVAGTAPSFTVWEDDEFLAFLSIFPNTDGVTVVIPKQHHPSYILNVPNEVVHKLLDAAKTVAAKIDVAFEDVGRTGMVLEGFGVDHLHAKLFPMHGTKQINGWKQISSTVRKFYTTYPGYIASHDGDRVGDDKLKDIAKKIKSAVPGISP